MTESKTCPKCEKPLPADAPAGLCPQCLLRAAVSPGDPPTGIDPTIDSPARARSSNFTAPPLETVQQQFPQFEVLELLGQGGMGAVYKARQTALDRVVAIKILPPDLGEHAAFTERFTREARALARLTHPNIVTVYDFGQIDKQFYLVMEFIDGVNLRQAIRGGELAAPQALAIVPQICDALQYAHDQGVVHRDIKPENILLDKQGRVKIADFGLAKLVAADAPPTALTGSFQVMGTLHYMAPEQLERPLSVDHRADIYSLGVVFYELLTGQLPLGRFDLPSERVQVDVRLDEVVLKALEREPGRRYQRASDVKTDMESIASHPRSLASPDDFPAAAPAALNVEEYDDAIRLVRVPALLLAFAGALQVSLPLFFCVLAGIAEPRFRNVGEAEGGDVVVPLAMATLGPSGFPGAPLAAAIPIPHLLAFFGMPGIFEIILLLGFMIPQGVFMLFGGFKMRRLELYPLALVGAALALLPCSPLFVINMPLGVWSLIVLSQSTVRRAFDQSPLGREKPKS